MKAAPLLSFAFCLLLARAGAPAPPGAAAAHSTRCPTITVECPEASALPGEQLRFTAKVRGAGPSPSLTFGWSTSAGTFATSAEGVITSPDAEHSVVLDTTGLAGVASVTVTFDVGGLDRSCANSGSCTTAFPQFHPSHPVDYYGNIRFEDEQARLDNFAIDLRNNPDSDGYIDCYGSRVGPRGEARARCERAKRYLTGRRGIAPDRIVLVDGGFREYLNVGLWVLPRGTQFTPTPTVDPSEVRFTDAPKKRRRRGSKRD